MDAKKKRKVDLIEYKDVEELIKDAGLPKKGASTNAFLTELAETIVEGLCNEEIYQESDQVNLKDFEALYFTERPTTAAEAIKNFVGFLVLKDDGDIDVLCSAGYGEQIARKVLETTDFMSIDAVPTAVTFWRRLGFVFAGASEEEMQDFDDYVSRNGWETVSTWLKYFTDETAAEYDENYEAWQEFFDKFSQFIEPNDLFPMTWTKP